MIDLLKKITELNKCPKCGGSGKLPCESCTKENPDCDCGMMPACPSCTGGYIVPELEKTESVMQPSFGPKVTTYHKRPRWHEGTESDGLPAPTTDEVLEMLPGTIELCGQEYEINYTTCIFDGVKYYQWSYENDEDELILKASHSPLLALLKLLRQYIEQKREGKV